MSKDIEAILQRNLVEPEVGSVERKSSNKWTFTSPEGREIDVTEEGVNFTQCFGELRPGETEYQREQIQFEMASLAVEIWGVVDTRKLPPKIRNKLAVYCWCYKLPFDDNLFRPFGIADAIEDFGESTKVGRSWIKAGWRITAAEGEAVIGLSGKDMTIRDVSGKPAMHEKAIDFLLKRQDHVIFSSSKKSFLMLMITHAERKNVECIPEKLPTFLAMFVKAHVVLWVVFMVGVLINKGDIPSSWAGWLLYYITANMVLLLWCWPDYTQKRIRKRGAELLNKFGPVHSGQREADEDEAERKGWLL